jgi:Domain of unknown function (DUF4920)
MRQRLVLPVLLLSLLPASVAVAQQSRPTSRPTSRPAEPAPPELPARCAPGGVDGVGVDLDADDALTLEQLLEDPTQYAERTIRLDALIGDVCQSKGCWMVLGDEEAGVRVRFVDYSFFVPRDSNGRNVIAQGQARVTEISEEMARHYAEESGHPERAEDIHGPQQVVAFTATGVEILGSDELPFEAEGEPRVVAALTQRLARAERVADTDATPRSAEAALAVLRATPGARTQEFAVYTRVEVDGAGWFLFGDEGGDLFEHGYGVRADTGEVFRF